MLSKKILDVMRQHNVRFNDFNSIKNANAYKA
jgi:hypothetical protein